MAISGDSPDRIPQKSRKYSTIKYSLSIIETFYLLMLLAVFLFSGFSGLIARAAHMFAPAGWLALPLYLLIAAILYYILDFPLNFYHTLVLEHQFQLSRQSLKDWFFDQLKAGAVSYLISIILLEIFYFLLSRQPQNWWWIISLVWIFFSLVLAKLAPLLIIPLFFKYKKLEDEVLRQKVMGLARKMKLKILDVFQIDLSRKTEKGNAALVGFGNTRRVILGDTLKDKYSPEEIEVILAHEFAHQKLNHLVKLTVSGTLTIVACMFVIYKTSLWALGVFGLASLGDIAALPLVLIYLTLSGIVLSPWENYLSRRFEKQADRMAIQSTGLKDAFVSTMNKLAEQNLADRSPHPLIKFFFFDHPSIDERIKLAQSLNSG